MTENGRDTSPLADALGVPRRRGLLDRLGLRRLREAEGRLAEHVHWLDERSAQLAAATTEIQRREAEVAALARDVETRLHTESAELDSREAALDTFAATLAEREAAVSQREHDVEQRRRELGAVELQRASVERREAAVAERERAHDNAIEVEVAQATSHVLFVPGERYWLAEGAGNPPPPGTSVELDGMTYLVARLGASPLPGDGRACAYLAL